jgi:beta-1,4-mannosyl-glycoprotein beta-1,4-N-acetylglucosaminyltransferase
MKRKVFYAIEFFNELDVLQIALETLNDVVDYFIISESTKSHQQGLPKSLYFEENKQRYAKFLPKIIHQIIDDTPDDFSDLSLVQAKDDIHRIVLDKTKINIQGIEEETNYCRDGYEKECLLRAMSKHCQDNDIVLVSDADEIPNPIAVKYVIDNFDPNLVYNFNLNHYWFYFNCLKTDEWIGNRLLTFANFKSKSMNELRDMKRLSGIIVKNAGWHFSFQGNVETIKQKIQSYGEKYINRPDVVNNVKEFIDDCIKNQHDFFYNPAEFTIVPLDKSFPLYLYHNQEKFKEFIYG